MPLIDITNPDVIKFLVDNYDKTTRLRTKWNQLNSDKLRESATLHRDAKGYYETDVLKQTMIEGMPTITEGNVVGSVNRRSKAIRDGTHIQGVADLKKGHSIPAMKLGDSKKDPRLARPDTDLTLDPIMRPIESKHKSIIYKDIPVFGREVYLKRRSRIVPENKYYFKEVSNWNYGWRLIDSFFSKNAPKYGRVWRLTRDVKSRTGPHPDPDHYKNPELAGLSKCA